MSVHEEYTRIVPESDIAVLFVHGIIGTPEHFREFIPLIPENVSVMNILLDGHGGSVEDFAKSSMGKWEKQVEDALKDLEEGHEKVLVVGHSMGTLLLLDEVRKEHKKVLGLFLLASPLVPWPKPIAAINSLKVILGKIKNSDLLAAASRDSCSIKLEKNLLKYLTWLPRYFELFCKASKVKRDIGKLRLPCTVIQSKKDELVSGRSCRYLRNHPNIKFVLLSDSYHFHYAKDDRELLHKEFISWYDSMTKANPST